MRNTPLHPAKREDELKKTKEMLRLWTQNDLNSRLLRRKFIEGEELLPMPSFETLLANIDKADEEHARSKHLDS